jgi:hypothetical protein
MLTGDDALAAMNTPTQPPSDGAGSSPAGWYPDPLSVATYRFWDGDQWTSNVSGGAVGGAKGSRGWRKGRTLIALGGVTLAVSPFLTWVKVVLIGDLNLLQLLQASGHGGALAWGAVLVGGVVALNVLAVGAKPRTVGITMGGTAGLVAVIEFVHLVHDIRQLDGLVTISYGPWFAVIGCAMMVVGGLLPERRSKPGPLPDGKLNP